MYFILLVDTIHAKMLYFGIIRVNSSKFKNKYFNIFYLKF